jgi:predicted secreted acid phosphatase
VLDIDESSLSNYDKMVARNFVANKEQLRSEIAAADSPAIKPMLLLYNDALQRGIEVFFVTGRKESERQDTIKNLKLIGFHTYSGLYLKPDNYNKPSIIPFKSQTRERIEIEGYKIIATIGDQQSDLKGGFAEKSFKLPNPYYYLP